MLHVPRPARLLLLIAATVVTGPAQIQAADAGAVDYVRDIKPILSDACYTCHGPDEATREAGFRLDSRESAVEWVITPGDADGSELLARIDSEDPEMAMPPRESNRPRLTEEQIALVRRWIEQGAEFNQHWAYVPPRRPTPPAVEESGAEATAAGGELSPVDAFVRLGLSKGIGPAQQPLHASPPADRRTLIRRLYFDLTGLPPSAEAVAQFVADDAPDAYERLVDRLLDSEHYGERMAIHWLDLVRYADSVGIHGDQIWSMSPYRDYVIRAFNENMPFDQFTVEQLAGDLLPDPTLTQRVASGYNRLNMITAEGGAQAKEYLAKYAADRVRTTSTVWLGATLGCAECHDHKFDPYTTKDFYQFAAFFADLEEQGVYNGSSKSGQWGPNVAVPTPAQSVRLAELESEIAATEQVLKQPTDQLLAALREWEQTLGNGPQWQVLSPVEMKSEPTASLTADEQGAITASGDNPDKITYTLTFQPGERKITALRLEALSHETLPAGGPGRAANGNFVLNGLELRVDSEPAPLADASATHEQDSWPVDSLLGADRSKGWAILPQAGQPNEAVLALATPMTLNSSSALELKLVHHYGSGHALGRFRVSVIDAAGPVQAGQKPGVPEAILAIAGTPSESRTDEQASKIAEYYRGIAPQLAETRERLARLRSEHQSLNDSLTTSLVSVSMEPRTMRVLPRGNWMDDSGEEVLPGVPAFLSTSPDSDRRQTRLDLARWMVDPTNPLVARVWVNRLWKICFGQGLVSTHGDFGSQGAVPTHPQLLDWLATEFVESGWDTKHILRLIAVSDTYQQSSGVRPELREHDPLNKRLARQGRFRLPAEMIRDNALTVSGLLVEQIGGESAKPYQPAGYWSHLNFPTREYQRDSGSGLYRRGLYTHWQRTFLHPSLAAFDAPTREECTVERTISNTPLQALVLLNDPSYVEAARALATKILQHSAASDQDAIGFACQQALQRPATAAETKVLLELLENHRRQYESDSASAESLNSVGEFRPPQEIDVVELAAWSSVARVILNLHETINRY